jgi:5-methylcytosine-specific restriction enzyme A
VTRKRASAAETKRRKAVVDAWRAEHGNVCPGYGRQPAHPSQDLTADHILPVAYGGPESGPLSVRCRGCNTRRRFGC